MCQSTCNDHHGLWTCDITHEPNAEPADHCGTITDVTGSGGSELLEHTTTAARLTAESHTMPSQAMPCPTMRPSSEGNMGNKSIFATLVPVSGSFASSSVGRITPGNAQLAATAERTCAARVTLSMRRHTWQATYTATWQTRNAK